MAKLDPPGSTGLLTLSNPIQARDGLKAANADVKLAKKQPSVQPLLNHYESFLIPALVLFMLGNALAMALPDLAFAKPAIGFSIMGLLIGLIIYTTGQSSARWKIRVALWLIVLIAGSLFYRAMHFRPAIDDVSTFSPLDRAAVMGTIETLSSANRMVIRVKTVNGQTATGQVLATLPENNFQFNDLRAGRRVLITGDLREPFHSDIPGSFDQEKYLATQQITALIKRPERLLLFETSNAPRYVLQRTTDYLKMRIADTFSRHLPSPHAELLGGLVLGDKAIPVDRDVRQAFIQTGLVHLLAASGFNVGIIAAAVLWLLSRLRWDFRAKLLATMGAVAFYSLLTGLPPSIQRATTMLEIALFLKLLNRRLSPTLLLCVAGSVLLLLHPDHISSIGFQFSMLTTFGLMTMVPPLQEKLGYYMTRWLAGLLLVPMVAQLWVWPLSVFYFNQFPVHAVLLNLFAMLLAAPLTIMGFTAATVSLVIPSIGGLLAWFSMPLLNALLMLAQWGQSMTWAQWILPSPSPVLLILLYVQLCVCLGLLLRFQKTPLKQKMIVALLPLLLILGVLCSQKKQQNEETRLALLPLSFRHQGYLIKPQGQNEFLAALPEAMTYFESRAVVDYLKHHQISALKAVILLPDLDSLDSFGNSSSTLLKPFKHIRIQQLIGRPDTIQHLEIPQETAVLLTKQAKVQLGPLKIMMRPHVKIISKQQCLLEITDAYKSDSMCGMQVIQENSGVRLFSASSLDARHYYEMHHKNDQLIIY